MTKMKQMEQMTPETVNITTEAIDKEAGQNRTERAPVCDIIKKRRFGDRKDGRRVRSLPPMSQLIPYIMKERSDAQNHISETLDIGRVQEYINKKKSCGMSAFGFMHFIIAAYIRTVAEYPALNRFVNGQKVFTRDGYAEVSLTIKREMKLESPDTVVKITLSPEDTADDVYNALNSVINEYRSVQDSGFDRTAKMLNYIPGFVKRFAFASIRFFDYLGFLPRALTRVSPFHSSMFITSMGSLGIPPVYHHLYNLGNVPLFISFGLRRRENVLEQDGSVRPRTVVDLKIVTDERICDGYYFAAALKSIKRYFRHPELLDERPAEVKRDID